jgi:hypothetical protein
MNPSSLGPSLVTGLHIAAGSIVLVVAPLAFAVRKGGAWHRRWGAAFMWAMAGVTGTAALMWQATGHLFLLWLDVITVYLVIYGRRTLVRREADRTPRSDAWDVAAAIAVIASGIVLAVQSREATASPIRDLAVVMIALGAIGATFGGLDLAGLFFGAKQRYGKLFFHLSAMLAAYISAVTAFIVINAHGVPMLYRWIVPVGIGTLVIVVVSAKYRLRYIMADRRLSARSSR